MPRGCVHRRAQWQAASQQTLVSWLPVPDPDFSLHTGDGNVLSRQTLQTTDKLPLSMWCVSFQVIFYGHAEIYSLGLGAGVGERDIDYRILLFLWILNHLNGWNTKINMRRSFRQKESGPRWELGYSERKGGDRKGNTEKYKWILVV